MNNIASQLAAGLRLVELGELTAEDLCRELGVEPCSEARLPERLWALFGDSSLDPPKRRSIVGCGFSTRLEMWQDNPTAHERRDMRRDVVELGEVTLALAVVMKAVRDDRIGYVTAAKELGYDDAVTPCDLGLVINDLILKIVAGKVGPELVIGSEHEPGVVRRLGLVEEVCA